jgi:hypothetical protein
VSGASSGEPLGCYFFHCKDTWQTCRKPCIFNVSFICTYNPGMIFFSYLTDFSYFSVKMKFRKLQDTVRTGQKWHFWNGCRLFQLPYSLSRIIPDKISKITEKNHPWVICTNKRNIKNTRFPTSLPCIFAMKKITTKRFTWGCTAHLIMETDCVHYSLKSRFCFL